MRWKAKERLHYVNDIQNLSVFHENSYKTTLIFTDARVYTTSSLVRVATKKKSRGRGFFGLFSLSLTDILKIKHEAECTIRLSLYVWLLYGTNRAIMRRQMNRSKQIMKQEIVRSQGPLEEKRQTKREVKRRQKVRKDLE